MTRLLSAELRKVWHSRFFLLAFSVLLGANLFLLWFGTGHTPGNVPSSAYRKLEQQISGMSMEDMDDFLHEELARTEGLSHISVSYTHLTLPTKTNVSAKPTPMILNSIMIFMKQAGS